MSDIEKIRLIHDLQNNFQVNDDTIAELLSQIKDAKYKDDVHRFFRGYSIEDKFKYLFASLPWVKQINSLGQDQLPIDSKGKYQVPDYLLLYETSEHIDKPILFEVKSVTGQKQTLELMSKQVNAIRNYARSMSKDILFAIYWEKVQMWTVNTIQNFKKVSKKYKIDLFTAMKNDMSVILGDLTFLIDKQIFRKTIADPSLNDPNIARHEEYGTILQNYVSIDNMANWQEIISVEAAIIDSFIEMAEIKVEKDDGKIILFEKSKEHFHGPRLSALIMRHLGIFNLDMKGSINGIPNATISRKFIIEFMQKLTVRTTYMLPLERTETSDRIFEEAFANTFVLDAYKRPRS